MIGSLQELDQSVPVEMLQSNMSKHKYQNKYEPPRGKSNNVVSDQVRHKPTCTVTEKS